MNEPLTEEEKKEALRLQEIARRAEEKALLRLQTKNDEASKGVVDKILSVTVAPIVSSATNETSSTNNATNGATTTAKFLSKQEREKLAIERLEAKRKEQEEKIKEAEDAHTRFITGKALEEKKLQEKLRLEREEKEKKIRLKEDNKDEKEMEVEMKSIREHYLGGAEKKRKIIKPSEKFQKIFQFDWENDDDTSKNDINPLYAQRVKINTLFGRGYIAGTDQREQRKESNFLLALSEKRMKELQTYEEQHLALTDEEKASRNRMRLLANESLKKRQLEDMNHGSISVAGTDGPITGHKGVTNGTLTSVVASSSSSSSIQALIPTKGELKRSQFNLHWSEKDLSAMTERDWRIFREDFDIRIQGGRATYPLRYWAEGNFPPQVMKAIAEAGYEKPSPIQRQAIPVGQAKKDIIGIAETGSGKTAAFIIPLLCYLLQVPVSHLSRTADEGPLAIIMAPTRELAQQIETECIKLAKFTDFITANVVGGQSIEEQGFKLRKGVHIVIGTPGRLCDCLQNNYLVLNQCNYVVLDEADRMVDMGFEVQVVEVLDCMGGLLKSEDEEVLENQLKQLSQELALVSNSSSSSSSNSLANNNDDKTLYRVTAMFSATMPLEVERIARTYLRHPVVIKIGDEDTGKNKRIEQRVYFISESAKKNYLMEELRKFSSKEKAIVFINSKKQGDTIGRYLETTNIRAGVLHSGRSQDQREETLDLFRKGEIRILVATDVAGRGLDIADVTHVINYDVPQKIDSYCHRIGRTGRAGKFGIAISFITDTDTEIMYSLKEYLEATNSAIPQQLAKHPAAQVAAGTRDDKGNIIGQKKDKVMYAKK